MARYLTRKRTLLGKVETTSGQDAAPTVGADALLVEEPRITPEFQVDQTNEVGDSLDARSSIVGGGFAPPTFTILLKGSGSAGTAPEFGPELRGAAMAEDLLAAAVSGTATAGGSNTITLAAGDGGSAKRGHVIATTGGTGSGQVRVVDAVAGDQLTIYPDWDTTPDGTTQYELRACALYSPASVDLETLTLYLYEKAVSSSDQARLTKVLGSQGSFSLTLPVRQIGRMEFNYRGILAAAPTNVADPGAATYDATRPRPFINAQAFLGGAAVRFRQFSLDWGLEVQQQDDPAAVFGYDVALGTNRRATGRINPQLTLLSARNVFQDFLDGAQRQLWLNWGETAGNRVSLYIPAARYTGREDEDVDGFAAEGVPFEAQGFDEAGFLCFH